MPTLVHVLESSWYHKRFWDTGDGFQDRTLAAGLIATDDQLRESGVLTELFCSQDVNDIEKFDWLPRPQMLQLRKISKHRLFFSFRFSSSSI